MWNKGKFHDMLKITTNYRLPFQFKDRYNILRNSTSKQIQLKWTERKENEYFFRSIVNKDLIVPNRPKKSCTGFTYTHSKLFNMLPKSIRESQNQNSFKSLIKTWIWENIQPFQSKVLVKIKINLVK